jgi:guanylate kinase
MDQKGKGLIFIVSAPSGAGKTTLVRKVMEALPGLRFSVSYTTRPPRTGEKEGIDYHFISPGLFRERVEKDQFLEWAEVMGHRYGTGRVDPEALKSEGADLILDIDTQGAKRAKEKLTDAVLIFILPPSIEALEERLIGRGLDPPERIRIRLAHAKSDMEEARWYQYVIVNDKLEEGVAELKAIIVAERQKKRATQ